MIEEKLSNAFVRYGIDTNASPKPWITADDRSGLHHHFILEILPSTLKETWLKKFVATQYRWKISVWSGTNERISSDLILPIQTSRSYSNNPGDAPLLGSPGKSRLFSRSTPTSASPSEELLVFDLDYAANILQKSTGMSSDGLNREWFVEDGVHLVVEIVHEACGIPISRGIIPLKPQEGFDPEFFTSLRPIMSKSGEKIPPSSSHAGPMGLAYNNTYCARVPLEALPNRKTGLEGSIKRASNGAELHSSPVYFSYVVSFTQSSTRAAQWAVRPTERYPSGLKLRTLHSHVPSASDVLPKMLRTVKRNAAESTLIDNGYATEKASERSRGSKVTSGGDLEPVSTRYYVRVQDMHISEDLMELCKSDRVVLTAHYIPPPRGGKPGVTFKGDDGKDAPFLPQGDQGSPQWEAEEADHAEVVMNLPRPIPSDPAARPVAIAEFTSNDDGDFYRQCELAVPSPHSTVPPSHASQASTGVQWSSELSGTEQAANSGSADISGKLNTDLTALQLQLLGLSTEGNLTFYTRTGQKFSHGVVDLCIGTMTMLERVREEDEDDDSAAHGEIGDILSPGLYRVPLYSQPSQVVIDNKTVTTTAPGVLVGEVFLRLAVQHNRGDKSLHQPHARALLVSPHGTRVGGNSNPPSVTGDAERGSPPSHNLLFARRLAAMLDSPHPLTIARVMLCETVEAEFVLANETMRRARASSRAEGNATRATWEAHGENKDDEGDDEEEEDNVDSEADESDIVALLSMFTPHVLPMPVTVVIELLVQCENRLRVLGALAAADIAENSSEKTPRIIPELQPGRVLYLVLLLLFDRLASPSSLCDVKSLELVARAIDDRGASSTLWQWFQASLTSSSFTATLSGALPDDGEEEDEEELSVLPTPLDWRQVRVAAWCLRVLSVTSWIDRNRALGNKNNTGNLVTVHTRNLSVYEGHPDNDPALSVTSTSNTGSGKQGSDRARRRGSTGSIIASSLHSRGGGQREDGGDGDGDDVLTHSNHEAPYGQYDGNDTKTLSLAQDYAVLVLEHSTKVVLTLLHEYHSVEATVHANNQEYRRREQLDFVRQALLELRCHRLATCSALMNVLSQSLAAVSPLMAITTREISASSTGTEGRSSTAFRDLLRSILKLTRAMTAAPLSEVEEEEKSEDEDNELLHDESDSAAKAMEDTLALSSSTALTVVAKLLCNVCVLAGPALDDLEHIEERRFSATSLYKQIQGESKLQRREAGDLPKHGHGDLPKHGHGHGNEKAHFADAEQGLAIEKGHDEQTATASTLISRTVACLATLVTTQPTLTSPALLYALHELSGVLVSGMASRLLHPSTRNAQRNPLSGPLSPSRSGPISALVQSKTKPGGVSGLDITGSTAAGSAYDHILPQRPKRKGGAGTQAASGASVIQIRNLATPTNPTNGPSSGLFESVQDSGATTLSMSAAAAQAGLVLVGPDAINFNGSRLDLLESLLAFHQLRMQKLSNNGQEADADVASSLGEDRVLLEALHHHRSVVVMLLGSAMGYKLPRGVPKDDPHAVQAQFLEKGAAGGTTGINYIRSLIVVSRNVTAYWKAARALYEKRGDVVVSGTGMTPAAEQMHISTPAGAHPQLVPSASSPPSCPSSPASHSLYQRLSLDVSLVVHIASVLIHRAYSDDDLSPVEVRTFHRHQARYTAHSLAIATARGSTHHSSDLSITAWLSLRKSLLETISAIIESAATCGLFSAKEIQAQAESELFDVLVGAPPGTGTQSNTTPGGNNNSNSGVDATSSSSSSSDAPASKQFAYRMEALRQLAQLHNKEGASSVSEAAAMAEGTAAEEGTLDVPLTRLVWLLRDLADMSPLLEGRPDLVLLCLSRKSDAEHMLRTLLQTSLSIPLGDDEEHREKRERSDLKVPLFHHRYHTTLHQRNISAERAAAAPDRHAHIIDDHSRVRARVHAALKGARADLLAACVTIMQILSTDSRGENAANSGRFHKSDNGVMPMRCEGYFQSLLDALLLRCVPQELSRSPQSCIAVLLGAHQDLHHGRLRTHDVSPLRCASMINTLMKILGTHTDRAGDARGGSDTDMNSHSGAGDNEPNPVDDFGMPIDPGATPTPSNNPSPSPIERLRQRLALRLYAVRVYVLSRMRLQDLGNATVIPSSTSLCEVSGKVLLRQYNSLSAASALQHLLHMAPHSYETGLATPRGAVWALGLMERAQVLQELARLAPAKVLTHDGDVKIDGILSSSGEVGDISGVIGDTDTHTPTASPKLASTADAKEATSKRAALSASEELGQWQRHIRLLLPPCLFKSTSSGHQVARRLYDLHLTRLSSPDGEVTETEVLQARAALQALCEAGEWELGVSISASMKDYYGGMVVEYNNQAHIHATINTAAAFVHHQQIQRYRSLLRESELSLDSMKRYLLHEGDNRLLPVYYAVRILNPGWLNVHAATGSAHQSYKEEAIEALAAATHCDVVGVMDGSTGSENPEPIDTPATNSSEAWLLLRYDLSSHSVSGQAYRNHAREMSQYVCPSGDPPAPAHGGAGGLPEYITTGNVPRDNPATPLPPACLPVIERGLALAFPTHVLATSNAYLTPAFSHLAHDPTTGHSGCVVESEYTRPHIGAKLIQIFEAVPSEIVEDFHATTKRENDERARLDHVKREQARYAAKKRGVVSSATHPGKKGGRGRGGSQNKQNKDGGSATRSNASAASGNSGGGGFGSSFDNFAPSTGNSTAGGIEDDGFAPSNSQPNTGGDSTTSAADYREEYNSSSISRKHDALEAQLSPHKRPVAGISNPKHPHDVEISDPSFCQASYADSFYIYTICEPLPADQKTPSDSSGVKRWRMDVLSASKGYQISRGHHTHMPSADFASNEDRGDVLSLDQALHRLHFLSPMSILHSVGDVKRMTAFEASREMLWYQQKQLMRISAALNKCKTLTSGEIAQQTSRDVGNLESVLAGATTQLLNLMVEPHRGCAVSMGGMRSVIAGEIERLEAAKQLERKLIKREWMRSSSLNAASKHDFFDEKPAAGPNFAHLDAKYARMKRGVEDANRSRIECLNLVKAGVDDFRSCVELVHRVLSDGGGASGYNGLDEAKDIGDAHGHDLAVHSGLLSRNTDASFPMSDTGEHMDEDDAFITETWTQICMTLEANLASLDVGCAI